MDLYEHFALIRTPTIVIPRITVYTLFKIRKLPKMPYYAVAKGRLTGVYSNWSDCKSNVNGYSGARYKKFNTLSEATQFAQSGSSNSSRSSTSTSSSDNLNYHRSRSSGGIHKPSTVHSATQIPSLNSSVPRASSTRSNHQKIYVDGASRGNGKSGIPKLGYGVYYGPGDSRNAAVPLSDVDDVRRVKPTNQRAELHGLRHSLRDIYDDVKKNPGSDKLYEILTDSSYGKNAIDSWSKKWKTNGWKSSTGQEIANRDLIEESVALYDEINASLKVQLTHVPGHRGIPGNEAADQLANRGADQM